MSDGITMLPLVSMWNPCDILAYDSFNASWSVGRNLTDARGSSEWAVWSDSE